MASTFIHRFLSGAQIEVHLPVGVRVLRVRLVELQEGHEEEPQQGRAQGDDAGGRESELQ